MKEYDTFIKSLEKLMLEGMKQKIAAIHNDELSDLGDKANHHLNVLGILPLNPMLRTKRGWIPHTNPKEVK